MKKYIQFHPKPKILNENDYLKLRTKDYENEIVQ